MTQPARRVTQVTVTLLVLYWLAIFTSTHLPHLSLGRLSRYDKVFHFCAFCGLAVLVCTAWSLRVRLMWRHYVGVLLLAALYGAVDELSQILVKRDCEFSDWCTDLAGATTGMLIFHLVAGWKRHRSSTESLVVPRRIAEPATQGSGVRGQESQEGATLTPGS